MASFCPVIVWDKIRKWISRWITAILIVSGSAMNCAQ